MTQPLFTLQWGINGTYNRIRFPDPNDVPFFGDCIVFAAKDRPYSFAILDEKDRIVKQGRGNLPKLP